MRLDVLSLLLQSLHIQKFTLPYQILVPSQSVSHGRKRSLRPPILMFIYSKIANQILQFHIDPFSSIHSIPFVQEKVRFVLF